MLLTKAQSMSALPQITLTDFDQQVDEQVLFGNFKTLKKKTSKVNIVLPNTSRGIRKLLSEDSEDSSETEGTKKIPTKTVQKPQTKALVINRQKKCPKPSSVTLEKSTKARAATGRRGSLDVASKKLLVQDRRGSLESTKIQSLSTLKKKIFNKAKPINEKTQQNIKSALMKKTALTSVSIDDDEEDLPKIKELSKNKKKAFMLPTSVSVGNISKSLQNESTVCGSRLPVENKENKADLQSLLKKFNMDTETSPETSKVEEQSAPVIVQTNQPTAIAKHMMNTTKLGLRKFKKVAKQKGVPEVDPYDLMCERSMLLGGTGRRIFDKTELYNEDEIKDDNIDERIKNVKAKYMDAVDPPTPPSEDLGKDPMKDFGLWDNCDPKLVVKAKGDQKVTEQDIIAELPDYERTKEKKDEMAKYLKDFNSLVIQESSASKSKLSTGKYLSQADFDFCVSHTKFEEAEILRWFKGFRKECPTGHLARDHVKRLFIKVFPAGNGTVFTNNIFRIFDNDNNGFMDFKEFLMALDVTTCKTSEDKLKWAFQLYDIDGNGTIDLQEMIAIIEILDDLGGREVGEEYLVFGEPEMLASAEERARGVMLAIDEDGDGGISLEEWLEIGKKLFAYEEEE